MSAWLCSQCVCMYVYMCDTQKERGGRCTYCLETQNEDPVRYVREDIRDIREDVRDVRKDIRDIREDVRVDVMMLR